MNILTKTQCTALRGIAIIGILLHNFLHQLPQIVQENEFCYSQENVDRLCNAVMHPAMNVFYDLISFFGHYGVSVFIFLSGYGLVMKYEKGEHRETLQSFIKKHYLKLLVLLMPAFAIFVIVAKVTGIQYSWTPFLILRQLTMTINLWPRPDAIIFPGPYWFFGVQLELYLIYITVLYKRNWKMTCGLMVLCWLAQSSCYTDTAGTTIIWMRYNFVGSVLPFCTGILLARYEDRIEYRRGWNIVILLCSLIAVCLGSLSYQTWLWVPVFVILLHIALVQVVSEKVMKPIIWIGTFSAAVFACHPIIRAIFLPISKRGFVLEGLALYFMASLLVSVVYKTYLKSIHNTVLGLWHR